MPFVSYAQNREDVVLWRALSRFTPGTYIDVGAADPNVESETRAFYEAGWQGVNIEPMWVPFEALQRDRPRDTNLNVALEETAGTGRYFSVAGGNGLSTGVESYATDYRSKGWNVDTVEVVTTTLADVCALHVSGPIHFLKIDVEGSERRVLAGADFVRFRPWIVVVEAVAPQTLLDPVTGAMTSPDPCAVRTHGDWESLLLEAQYCFVLFDGLNRFYVAEEHAAELVPLLEVPANVLDDVVSAADHEREVLSLRETELLRDELDRTRVAVRDLADLRAEFTDLQQAKLSVDDERQILADALDAVQQALFESSRHIGALAGELQRTEDELNRRGAEFERDLAALNAVHGISTTNSSPPEPRCPGASPGPSGFCAGWAGTRGAEPWSTTRTSALGSA